MKTKNSFSLFILLLFAAVLPTTVQAIPNILLDDFESGNKGWSEVMASWEIVNNPHPDAVNSSAKVLKVTRTTGSQWYAGVILRGKMTVDFGSTLGKYRYAHLKVLKETSGTMAFKLENDGDAGSTSSPNVAYTPNGSWQEVVFDLGAAGQTYKDFFIQIDHTANPSGNITVYIDDITFKEDPNGTEPPSPELPCDLQLVWADEFDAATYDANMWSPHISGGGFGNNELQYYTGNSKNIFTRDGFLVLKAFKENYSGHSYTSGKLWSMSKVFFTYGRVEARFKVPQGRGAWPAIWMMPQSSVYGGWPHSGEIDMLEYVGYQPNTFYGTVHRGAGSGSAGNGNSITKNDNDFHTIRIDWEPGYIKWYLDDELFHTYNNAYTNTAQWPFDQDFYLILNFAVGGDWGGAMGVDESIFPQEFLIDYVRVYQHECVTSLEKNTISDKTAFFQISGNVLKINSEKFTNGKIYSITGNEILSFQQQNVDISVLPKGVYIVAIKENGVSSSAKFVK